MDIFNVIFTFLINVIDFVIHIDIHLNSIIQSYGVWTYLILFLIVFCETGFVVTPFLPGDSLLFAAGAFSAVGSLNHFYLFVLLSFSAVIGDSVNYSIGNYLGDRVYSFKDTRFFKKAYLEKTHNFYEKYGGKTIIIARFMPIIRTFAPFVAGIGKMSYSKFLTFNVVGGVLWVTGFIYMGYFFGNIPVVKRNFTLVIMAIIIISVLPGFIEFLRHRAKAKRGAN